MAPGGLQDAIKQRHGYAIRSPRRRRGGNWAQRLGMAVLSMTKLAPYAQQIIHPAYTQQMAGRAAAEKELQGLSTAEETQQRGAYYQQQADESKGRYLRVGTGVFDQQEGKWVTMPMDKSNLVAIDPKLAKERGLAPLGDGTYMVPASVASQFVKPGKEPGGFYVQPNDQTKKLGLSPDPESGLVYIPKEGVGQYTEQTLRPPAAATPESQKIAYQNALGKMHAAGELPANAATDSKGLARAIDQSKALSPAE